MTTETASRPKKKKRSRTTTGRFTTATNGGGSTDYVAETKNSRWRGLRLAGLIAAFLFIGAGLLAGGFFIGQSTRDSASEVQSQLDDLAARDHAEATAALQAQSVALNRQAKKDAQAAREAGYESGQSDGYESGVSDGEAQGYDEGYDEGNIDGYSDGFGEGTCYDPITFAYVC